MEMEELGMPLPAGMQPVKIKSFPTPGSVIDQVTYPERQQMLKRLYPEYKRLCAYAHGSVQNWIAKTALDAVRRSVPTSIPAAVSPIGVLLWQ